MSATEYLDKAIALLDALLASAKPSDPAPAKAAEPVAAAPAPAPVAVPVPAPAQAPKAAKAPKPAAAAAPAAPAGSEDEALFSRALLKVAHITSVEPLANSEKLYKLKIDIGGGETRQVCAGLRQYLAVEQLQGARVCVVANLKPAKLAGEVSEAMVLASEVEMDGKLAVRTLIPPVGAAPGDVLFLSEGAPTATPDKVLKSDHWKKINSALKVQGGKATFNGRLLATAAGDVTLPAEIPDGAEIR